MKMENAGAFQAELETWLYEISAYRFGLGEVEEGHVLYLAGSNVYDVKDDEWAAYPPEFLAKKEFIISDNEERAWYWILLEVINTLGRCLRKKPVQSSFLGGTVPVYTGFESGDLYRIK